MSQQKSEGAERSAEAARAANAELRAAGKLTHRTPNGLTVEQIVARRASGLQSARVNKAVRRTPCCGAMNDAVICCALDPRAHPTEAGKRLPGDWCLWCGEHVRDGRSYCTQQCSYSYHQDVLESQERAS